MTSVMEAGIRAVCDEHKGRYGCMGESLPQLVMHWFKNRWHAKVLIEQWRKHYDSVRPHSSLGYQTLIELGAGRSNVSTTEARISS
jgi:transposase InsO family protein